MKISRRQLRKLIHESAVSYDNPNFARHWQQGDDDTFNAENVDFLAELEAAVGSGQLSAGDAHAKITQRINDITDDPDRMMEWDAEHVLDMLKDELNSYGGGEATLDHDPSTLSADELRALADKLDAVNERKTLKRR